MRKKSWIVLGCALAAALLLFALTACGGGNSGAEVGSIFCTVSFDLNGGTMDEKNTISDVTVKKGENFSLKEYIPTKEHYVFDGWRTGDALYKSDEAVNVTKDLKLTAQWSDIVYTVRFDLDGGMMSVGEVRLKENEKLQLADYQPKKKGFSFEGWELNLGADFPAQVIPPDGTAVVSRDTTLKALWKESYHAIRFSLGGGTMEPRELTVRDGDVIRFSEYIPKKKGFQFLGWQFGDVLIIETAEQEITQDMELVALWKEAFCTVRFELNGGTMHVSDIQLQQGTMLSFSEYVPKKKLYTFIGWKDSQGTMYTSSESMEVLSDVTLSAVWEKTVTAADVFAYTELADGYRIDGFSETASVEQQKNLVFPREYNQKPITEIKDNAFAWKNRVETVDLTVCTGLKKIGKNAFIGCWNLKSIDLSGLSALTDIGFGAFGGNKNGGSSLATVNFAGCTALKTLGEEVLAYQSALKKMDLSDCTALETLGKNALNGCTALEQVSLPKNLKTVGDGAFVGCKALSEIRVDAENSAFRTENGALYDFGKTQLIRFAPKSSATEFTVPATVVKIGEGAFADAVSLRTIDLSGCGGLEQLGAGAFANCSAATVRVPFNNKTFMPDGTKLSVGTNWNQNVKAVEYADFAVLEMSVTGISDGFVTKENSLRVLVRANFGDNKASAEVSVNGTRVQGQNDWFTVPLQEGENTVVITAKYGDKTLSKTYTVTKKTA